MVVVVILSCRIFYSPRGCVVAVIAAFWGNVSGWTSSDVIVI